MSLDLSHFNQYFLNGIFYKASFLEQWEGHSLHPSPLYAGGGGGWTSYQIFKKGDLTGPQFLEEIAGTEGGVVIFSGASNFR